MGSGYRIIIVDDEFFIRDGLMSFDWESLGFIASGSAQNGRKALELLEREPADVLITDIKMPVMDGLELSRVVHDSYPSCKIVILTGYKDFEYARTAISAGAVDYLLKPVNRREIEKLFLTLKEKLDKEHSEKSLLDSFKKRFDTSYPLALESLARSIAEGKFDSTEEIVETLDNLEVNFDYRFFSCAIFQLDTKAFKDGEEGAKLVHKLREVLQKPVYIDTNLLYYFEKTHQIVVLFNFDSPGHSPAKKQLLNITRKVCEVSEKSLEQLNKVNICAGVGSIFTNCLSLSKSYEEADKALNCRFSHESEKIICIWDICKDDVEAFGQYPYDTEEKLLNSVLEGRMEDCRKFLGDFWLNLEQTAKGRQKTCLRDSLTQLLGILERKVNKLGISMEGILHMPPPFTGYIDNLNNISEVRNETEAVLLKVAEAVSSAAAELEAANSLSVQKAKEYIRNNYNKKITLKDVADHVYLNACYFSLLFKKQTDSNFIEYLTEYRMEKARELLKRTDLKIYEVGELVGYENTKYFTDIFKKVVSISPKEYRNKNIKEV